MKRKRIASISMAHIEDIGELEGKKSLFENILVSFKAKEIWKVPSDFRLDFKYFFQFSGKVNYRFNSIVNLHCKNCLTEQLNMFSKLR